MGLKQARTQQDWPPALEFWSWNWKPGLLSQKFLLFLLPLCCHLVNLRLSFAICEMGPGDQVR